MIKVDNEVNTIDHEKVYCGLSSIEHRQKYAQFFTPLPIAKLMSKWLLKNPQLNSVLEPAIGLGIFSRVLLSESPYLRITGFDIDSKVITQLENILRISNQKIDILQKDFITYDWNTKYDGIICNPPYFKFHDYDNKLLLSEVEKNINTKLSGFTNLHSLFILKSLKQLNENGRIAFIVPSEFLNSDYGKKIKSLMLKSGYLRHILIIDFEQNIFDDALTTACILLFANDRNNETVSFTTIHNINELELAQSLVENYPILSGEAVYPINKIDSEKKWRSYYQDQHATKYQNLVPFSKYGKVSRGIATGANDYFVLNKEKAKDLGIPSKYLLKCICKSVDVKSSFFTKNDLIRLTEANKSIYLFNAIDENNEAVNSYIVNGEMINVNEAFLTKHRKPWYKLENRPPAPIWVNVFNRGGLRFIRNEAGICNLTTFHSVYINSNTGIEPDLLFAYLLTDLSKNIFNDNKREYGSGLEKFEPNDINKALIPDLILMETEERNNILNLFQLYRNSVINGNEDCSYLVLMNEIFVKRYLN